MKFWWYRHRKISSGLHFWNGRHNTAKIQHCSISKVAFDLFFKPVVSGRFWRLHYRYIIIISCLSTFLKSRQISTTFLKSRKISTTFLKSRQISTTCLKSRQISTTCLKSRQISTTCHKSRQISTLCLKSRKISTFCLKSS
jgi:hypothetical protein